MEPQERQNPADLSRIPLSSRRSSTCGPVVITNVTGRLQANAPAM
jgi:hypothetical protein